VWLIIRSSRSKLEATGWHEVLEKSLKFGIALLADGAGFTNLGQDVTVLGLDDVEVHLFELADFGSDELVKVTSGTGVQNAGLSLDWHWHELFLLEELGELLTSVKELLGGGIEIGTELSEGGNLSVLSELELEGTGKHLHGLDLSGGSDSGDGETDVNGWADTLVEELSLEEDLSVGNGNNVGWDVSGHITSLGLDNWEGGQGTGSVVLVHLGCTLEETRMEVEDITWVSLTTGWSSEEERHLSVGNSLLGEIVVDDEGVLAVVSEVLTDGASGVWSQELERGGL